MPFLRMAIRQARMAVVKTAVERGAAAELEANRRMEMEP